MTSLWHACEQYLKQAEGLVESLSPSQFGTPHAHCFSSTIGGHIRHSLEHFECFRLGVEDDRIDYDARQRETPEESDPAAAAVALKELAEWYGKQAERVPCEQRVKVAMDCGKCGPTFEDSSVGRELQFLISHTVHHFAIIRIMCDGLDVPLDPEFGFAPATWKYRQRAGNA